jgi:hypothetical protein
VFLDTRHGHAYISSSADVEAVLERDAAEWRRLDLVSIATGARTSLFVLEMDRLFPAGNRWDHPCAQAVGMTLGGGSGNAQFVERRIIHNTWTESQLSKYAFGMAPTLTTAYWLMKAADAWSQVETTQDQEAKRIKLTIARGYERLAKHAASLAAADQPEKQKLE